MNEVIFRAGSVLDGRVEVSALEPGFVWVRKDRGGYPQLAKALKYMTKFGWRVIGIRGDVREVVLLHKEG